jgi:hypothetical protein
MYVCMYVISTCLSEAVNVLMYDQACKCMYVCLYIHIMTLWKTRCTIIFMYVCMYVCMGSVYDSTMFNYVFFLKKKISIATRTIAYIRFVLPKML